MVKSFGTAGGKREREATRDRKKKEKEERLERNRALRAKGLDPDLDVAASAEGQELPEVKLEDINISGVAPRGPKGSNGPTKLFVGGLSWDTESEQLKAAFSPFGALRESSVVADRATGRSRGFGFVVFENPLDAAAAARKMNGAELDGRTIRVNVADRG
jgi:RNA recognition motif-containing protein